MDSKNFYLIPLRTLAFLPLRVWFLSACLPVYSSFAEAQEGWECLPLLLTAVPCWPLSARGRNFVAELSEPQRAGVSDQLVCSKKVPTKMWNNGLPVMFNSAKFFPNIVKAYSRDYSYCTKFDMVLQRLKQNQCLNNWTVKLFSLFPSQTEPVLTNVFKK